MTQLGPVICNVFCCIAIQPTNWVVILGNLSTNPQYCFCSIRQIVPCPFMFKVKFVSTTDLNQGSVKVKLAAMHPPVLKLVGINKSIKWNSKWTNFYLSTLKNNLKCRIKHICAILCTIHVVLYQPFQQFTIYLTQSRNKIQKGPQQVHFSGV